MKNIILFFFLLFTCSPLTFAQQNQICFTIDDLPVVNYGVSDTIFQQRIMSNLIVSLTKHSIPAIGFVNEKKMYSRDSLNQFQIRLLENWVKNGLELGNHTFSHIDYNTSSLQEYAENLQKGEVITKEILAKNGTSIKYFRHPFLHVGNTKEKADSLTDFLLKTGYTVAPVTFDSDDYLFAKAYQRSFEKQDSTMMKQVGHDYILHLEHKLKYYENECNKLFEKNIKHILLLHANLLNADYMDSIANLFIQNKYDFIDLDEALKDELYSTEITVYGKWGISWLDKWALSMGKSKDFFKDEPAVPSYLEGLSK